MRLSIGTISDGAVVQTAFFQRCGTVIPNRSTVGMLSLQGARVPHPSFFMPRVLMRAGLAERRTHRTMVWGFPLAMPGTQQNLSKRSLANVSVYHDTRGL